MPTFQNCYSLVKSARVALNDFDTSGSEAKTKGTDTTGHYLNEYIVEKINLSQSFIYNYLLKRIPEEFFETATLTGVNSAYTRPANFGKLLYFKDENGRQVYPIQERNRRLVNSTGSDRHYTIRGNTLVLDKAGITTAYDLLYYRKARELDFGLSTDGGALSITLALSAKKVVDYYNGMVIENVTDDWVDTVSDYTTGRVATIGTETGAASKYYGIVSDLPDMFHEFIAPKAVLYIKMESPLSEEKPSTADRKDFMDGLREALRGYAGSKLDVDDSTIFEDFSPIPTGGLRIISSS